MSDHPGSRQHTGPLGGAADYLKASYIKRWGIVNAPPQSIAEHQYRVWTLVRQWGPRIKLEATHQELAEEWALVHDLAEIRTGDAPTPHKTPEIKSWLQGVEHEVYPPIKMLESSIAGTDAATFCKFCDTAESILYLKLHGIGKHATDVQELLSQQLRSRLKSSSLSDDKCQILLELFCDAYHQS
jgi:hypothetical protein